MGCTEEVTDFLNKLVIYSNQADEDAVGDILKSEMEENQLNPNYLQVHTDAIFSKYHDEMLKWWKLPDQAPILTRENDYFQKAKQNIIKDPMLSLVTAMYHRQKMPVNFTFSEDAASSLNLENLPSNTVIITENSILTVVKVLQHLKNIDHVVLDMEYIVGLPPNDRNVLREELKNIDVAKVVILVCDNVQNDKNKILDTIAKAVLDKTTIIVANNVSVKSLQKYFTNPPVHDGKNSLIDMCEESQKNILENARVMFQDIEVTLGLIVDEKSKRFVKDDVLMKMIRKETIAIGKLIVKENYNEIKPFHIDRRIRKTGDDMDMVVNTFNNNLTDDVVLVAAEPGMGKSTLLTRLSINTKELKPEIWIVRVNLLEYSREFSMWNEENTVIDILETMKFLCQVILRDKLGKENKVEIILEEKDNVIYLKHCTADPLIELELNLFLHFYYERDMVFLFDGFDEICPHYMNVVLKCLKCLRDHHKQKMWITSRAYNEIRTVLEEEFGLSYEILHYTNVEMIKYLTTFWKNDFNLNKIKSTQLENVKKFLDYMAAMGNKRIPISNPFNVVFKVAACHLDFEITNESYNFCEKYSLDELRCNVNPLFLFLSALFVADNIENKDSKEWFLNVDIFEVYVRFLKIKIKRRYQEKNEMNIYNPDIISAYNKDITESISKHKKLGAYAIFHKFNSTLLSGNDLEEIKEMIKELEKGEDKSVLIDSVANGIPIFTHMSFTEYFAVEFLCDRLKTDTDTEKLDYFYMIFAKGELFNERKIFNHKLNVDKILMSILDQNEDVIFDWMLSLSGVNSHQGFAIICALNEDLNDIRSFFEKIINKNKTNISNKTSEQQLAFSILSMTLNMGKYFSQNENNPIFQALDSLFAGTSVLSEGFDFDYTANGVTLQK